MTYTHHNNRKHNHEDQGLQAKNLWLILTTTKGSTIMKTRAYKPRTYDLYSPQQKEAQSWRPGHTSQEPMAYTHHNNRKHNHEDQGIQAKNLQVTYTHHNNRKHNHEDRSIQAKNLWLILTTTLGSTRPGHTSQEPTTYTHHNNRKHNHEDQGIQAKNLWLILTTTKGSTIMKTRAYKPRTYDLYSPQQKEAQSWRPGHTSQEPMTYTHHNNRKHNHEDQGIQAKNLRKHKQYKLGSTKALAFTFTTVQGHWFCIDIICMFM